MGVESIDDVFTSGVGGREKLVGCADVKLLLSDLKLNGFHG